MYLEEEGFRLLNDAHEKKEKKYETSLWIEADVGPEDVEDSGADEGIFDEERVEERRRVHDDVAQKDAAAARNVARQFPEALLRLMVGHQIFGRRVRVVVVAAVLLGRRRERLHDGLVDHFDDARLVLSGRHHIFEHFADDGLDGRRSGGSGGNGRVESGSRSRRAVDGLLLGGGGSGSRGRLEDGLVPLFVVVIMSVDLFEGLADEGADPDADVGGQAVHQAEAGHHLELVNVETGRDEDEIHLEEGESGVEDGIEAAEERKAGGIRRHLEERTEFQAVVDHGAQSKGLFLNQLKCQ